MNVLAVDALQRGVKSPQKELEGLYAKSAAALDSALGHLIRGHAEPDAGARERGLDEVASLLRATKVYADLLGRYRVWREFDAATRSRQYAANDPTDPRTWEALAVPNVPFQEAYLDLVTREPRLAPSAEAVMALYSTEHVFALAKATELSVVERIQRYLAESKREGRKAPEVRETIAAMGDFTRSYAQTVYRTNLATAYSAGRRAEAAQESVREALPAFRFSTSRDVDVRSGREQDNGENHAAMEGYLAPTDHAVWDAWSPPLGYSCFLPDVSISGRIIGGLKARYTGPAVEIQTRTGATVSVTVNHPVLTRHGWRAAKDVCESDYLLCYPRGVEAFDRREPRVPSPSAAGRTVDDEQCPARAADVFEAIRMQRAGSTGTMFPVLPLDLHGDARCTDGYVEVVGTAGLLPSDAESGIDEEIEDGFLVEGRTARSPCHRRRHFDSFGERSFATERSAPSGSTLALYDRPVVGSRFSLRPLQAFCLGLVSDWNATSDETARQNGTNDPGFVRQLFHASAGQVAFDKVVKVRHFDFSGHVYDFSTTGGWILAGNIITSNCRCGIRLLGHDELNRIDPRGRWRRPADPISLGAAKHPGFGRRAE